MLKNYDVIVIFPIYGQFGAMRKPDSGRIVCKTYAFINGNLLSYKNWQQNLKIFNKALTLLLWEKVLFLVKNGAFLRKNADISRTKWALVLKKYIFWNYICVCTYVLSLKFLS